MSKREVWTFVLNIVKRLCEIDPNSVNTLCTISRAVCQRPNKVLYVKVFPNI